MSHRFFRDALLTTTIMCGSAIFAAPAFAQDAQGQTPEADVQTAPVEAVAPDAGDAGDEIVVTGTLIRNPNLVASSPVTVVGEEEIGLQQSNVAEELLRELPGVVPSVGSAVNNGNGGASFVNLRGLGENRNIVLLDGVRLVPSGLDGIVDLNNIPLALVERVDALTGGASTTYGADAVTGVINFITRDDFAGIDLNVSEQITEKGDGNVLRADLTLGANFDDGRGNAVFSIGYQQADPVFQGDRSFSRDNVDSFTGAVGGGSGTAVPGRFTGARLGGFNPVGGNGGTLQANPATGAFAPTFQLFNFNPQNIFQTPFERFNIFGAASYEVADGIQVYSQGLFSKNTVSTVIASSGTFGNALTIPLSNPFLTATQRNQFCAFDTSPPVVDPVTGAVISDVYVPRFSQAVCDAAATAQRTLADGTTPNPAYREVVSNVSRRFVEAGPRIAEYTTTFFNYKAGIRGDITDSLGFDLLGAYGESENVQRQSGNGTLTRLRQATLATNPTSCVDPTNGCVPINLFGPAGSITPEQLGFLLGVTNSTLTRTSLSQIRGVVSGDFGVSSPLANEAIGIAVGGEYRRYTAAVISDQLTQTPNEVLGNGAASPDVSGAYDVYEAFGEVNIPLVADRPFFQSLTVELGGRYSDYSTTGSSYTYKAGGSWVPVEGIKIRGAYNRATRAPNIGELFAPLVTGLDNGTDPCAGTAPSTNATLRAICLAQGAPLTTIGNIDDPSAGQVNVTGGGNLALDVEKATTYTIGAVLQPDFITGLSITADYYNIKVKDAISSQTVGDAILACFGPNPASPPAGAASNPACLAITRDPNDGGLNGTADGYPQPLSNLGRLATDGIDLIINYRRNLGFAGLNLSFNGNWTNSSKFNSNVSSPLAVNRECVGYYSINCGSIQPEFQFSQRSTLTFGAVDVSLLWRYVDSVRYEPLQDQNDIAAAAADPSPIAAGGCGPSADRDVNPCIINSAFTRINAEHYFDLTTQFEVTDNFTFTVSAQNLFNNQPKIVGAGIGATAYNSGNIYPSTYDSLGRRYAIAARVKF